MRRVVITGLGLVSPLGCGYETTWERLVAGRSATHRIENFDVSDLTCQIACQVPHGDGSDGTFNANDWMEPKEQRKVDEFIVYAMSAATQALKDAGWKPTAYEEQIRTGVLIGSGIGGLQGIEKTSLLLAEKGPRRVSPFFIPGRLINLAAGYVSIEHGLRGPNHAVVTACSTGAHAIGDASRLVALGDADVMLAGGTESPICRLAIAGFAACRALSTNFNDQPERASRPYDRDRDGFVMGEGAGIVVLEELEHAKARGARIYAEIIGYGLSGDAFHITAPAEDGDGALRCMKAALRRADLSPGDVDYINAHGTSTPLGDEVELKAVERLVGNSASRIVQARLPGMDARLARNVVGFVQRLRQVELTKLPGVAETLDWASALAELDVATLDPATVSDTLGVLLKYQDDIARLEGTKAKELIDEVRAELRAAE